MAILHLSTKHTPPHPIAVNAGCIAYVERAANGAAHIFFVAVKPDGNLPMLNVAESYDDVIARWKEATARG